MFDLKPYWSFSLLALCPRSCFDQLRSVTIKRNINPLKGSSHFIQSCFKCLRIFTKCFERATNNACPSISKQLGPSSEIVDGVSTPLVNMLASRDLFGEYRVSLIVARDSGTDISLCWTMLSKLTSRPAL